MESLKALKLFLILFLILGCFAHEEDDEAIVDYLKKNNFLHGKAEIVFLLDRSGSVGAANFEAEKGFVESFLTHIVVDANATRVAVITYSDTAERHIDYLREPKSKCFLVRDLQEVSFKDSGATNIAAALQEASLVFENARPNVNKVVVLISDGLANVGGDPVPYAISLKSSGVQIFSFGIGRYLKTELLYLASSANHVYTCSGFREFKRLARKIRGDPHEAVWSSLDAIRKCDYLCDSPYKGEPDDPGCCDHDAHCSCALLSGMHTCVCGPGYYGLSGLMGDCKACKRGTYKSTVEPARACTSCPSDATTAEEASKSVKDCYCKDGYHGDPTNGVNCTIINCPPLQPPTHGIILGNCERSYGSSCFFMCEEGYELLETSSDLRVCQSNGQWSGTTTVCRKIRCKPLQKPQFGYRVCDPGELIVGKKCSFSCWEGHIQQGSNERECLSSKKWSGTEIKCFPVECNLPPPVKYSQQTCSSYRKPILGETCVYNCFHGFDLTGPRFLTCSADGKLQDADGIGGHTKCNDTRPPEIKCPGPLKMKSMTGKNYASVQWTKPIPSDNSGLIPKLATIPPNIIPPSQFPIGISSFQYMAIDHVGLNTTCTVLVEVFDEDPPAVMECPSRVEAGTTGVSATVEWEEPVFVDNSGKIVKIMQSAKSGDTFSIGTHTVTYEAYDSNMNVAVCVFDVIISRTMCPHYPPPTNGALTCHDWMVGQFCQVYCNEKHDFLEKPAEWYICNSEAEWMAEPEDRPIPWPDCAKPAVPQKVKKMMKFFYYKGDCNDPNVQIYLKKIFLNNFRSKVEKSDLCHKKGSCSLQAVDVKCGNITDSSDFKRRRRDVWEHAAKEELELEFEILIDVDQDFNDTETVLQDFLETIRNLKWDLEADVNAEVTTLASQNEIGNPGEKAGNLEVTDEKTQLVCKLGSVLADDLCVLCPPGTYYATSVKDCLDCPVGYYQENEGQFLCEKCPEGMSTEYQRTRNITDCRDVCLPGTYSATGLETCMACPIGTYQENHGANNCTSCPGEKYTSNVQSTSSQNCKDLCSPGSFSPSGLSPCKLCPRSYYQPLSSQIECIECPANLSTLIEGASSISECLDLDPCVNEYLCLNGGFCKRVGRDPVCACRKGFEGKYCERDVDECLQNPCFNDGQCNNTIGSFTCYCAAGFSGDFCDVEINECFSTPCMNNGTCLDKVNGYICVCSRGYDGRNCENVQEICFNDVICLNGACVFAEGNETSFCQCQPGYSGVDCSIDVNECENVTCQNNGSCIDGVNFFICECDEGYNGTFCELEIDECEGNFCHAGSTCKDRVGFYECICPPGWNGSLCENKMDSNFVLMFPESTATIANMASSTINSPMSEATVSLWVQTTDVDRSGTPVSYAVASTSTSEGDGIIVDNALTISDCTGIQIYVNNEPLVTDLQVADGQWHHLAFAWTSQNSGMWTLYKDGQLHSEGKNLKSGDTIQGGGTMVIGQEQDTVGGGFSPVETFTGNISRLNIWNSYFSKSNVTKLCNMDDDIPGKIIAWPDFLHGIKGDVQVIKSAKPKLSEQA